MRSILLVTALFLASLTFAQRVIPASVRITQIDPDATAFLNAASISDVTISSAILNLVKDLKSNSLWEKCKAVYPYVGGTASTHKFNLKDPQDLDASFRITWTGSATHNSNGVTFPGSTSIYGDTHLNPTTVFGSNALSMHTYTRTWSFGPTMAAGTGNYDESVNSLIVNGGTSQTPTTFKKLGIISVTRTSTNLVSTCDGNTINDQSNTFSANGNENFIIAKRNGYATAFSGNIAFQAIMDALTISECATLATIVYNFEFALGRSLPPNVWFFGDSITAGVGASSNSLRWSTLLSGIKNWTEVNKGVSGATLMSVSPPITGNMYDRANTDIPTKRANDKYLFISYLINDAAQNSITYTTTLLNTQLTSIINTAKSRDWDNTNIIINSAFPSILTTWVGNSQAEQDRYLALIAQAQTTANANGVVYVNPFTAYSNVVYFEAATHPLHPQDTGHKKISDFISRLMP